MTSTLSICLEAALKDKTNVGEVCIKLKKLRMSHVTVPYVCEAVGVFGNVA